MGMFDSIYFDDEVILKLPKKIKHIKFGEFQTKDLQSCMTRLFVDKKGQIWEEKVEYAPNVSSKDAWPILNEISRERIKNKLTQTIDLCAYNMNDEPGGKDVWLELSVTFIGGKFKERKIKEIRAEDNNERLLREEELSKQMAETFKFRKSLKGRAYIFFIENSTRFARVMIRRIVNILNKVERFLIRY